MAIRNIWGQPDTQISYFLIDLCIKQDALHEESYREFYKESHRANAKDYYMILQEILPSIKESTKGGGRRPPPLWMSVWCLGGQQTPQKHSSPAKIKRTRRKIMKSSEKLSSPM